LAAEADLLIRDSQYRADEYSDHVGWGHSSLNQALDFAALSEVKHLVPFHYDPGHTDVDIDRLMDEAIAEAKPAFRVTPGLEGATFQI
jgi:ribonuclease BN (tRNA processing enzyme)